MADVFKRRCPHQQILSALEHCELCIAAERARAVAKAGPRGPRFDLDDVNEEVALIEEERREDCSCFACAPCGACEGVSLRLNRVATNLGAPISIVQELWERAFNG